MPQSVTPKNITDVKLYSKKYTQFRGVDFSTDPTQAADYRSPYALNLISDLAGFPEKRVGWRKILDTGKRINGIHHAVFASGASMRFVHAGTTLYTWDESNASHTAICETMADNRSVAFAHGGKMYIMDGLKYKVVSESGGVYTVSNVEDGANFIPTTSIGMTPDGAGTAFEGINMLSAQRKNSFIADGRSTTFQLDTSELDSIDSVKVDGETYTVTTGWTRTESGVISFTPGAAPTGDGVYLDIHGRIYICTDAEGNALTTLAASTRASFKLTNEKEETGTYYKAKRLTEEAAPTLEATLSENVYTLADPKTYVVNLAGGTVDFALPPADGNGIDTVVIQISKSIEGYADRVNKCSIFAFYGYNNDNRIFISGNPEYPSWDWQSGLDDPTYFPDTGYTKVGSDTSAIMGYLKQYNSLTIVKADNEQDAEVFLRTAQMEDDGTIIFPIQQGIKGVGAISKYAFATLRDDPLFLAREGVFAIASTSVQLERTVQDRSYFVNPVLTTEAGLSEAVAAVWNGYYILSVNGRAYVADSRKRTAQSGTGASYSESGSYVQYSYEWYYWQNIPARVIREFEGELYFGTADGYICKFNTDISTMSKYNDDGAPILARWATKMDDYGTIVRRKTLTKKGCGVMIKPYTRSSVTVYTSTDRTHEAKIQYAAMDILDFSDIDFSRFTFNTLDTPQVVPFNKKVKKFIVLQLIFENNVKDEGFGIYGVQTQFAIGGYVK